MNSLFVAKVSCYQAEEIDAAVEKGFHQLMGNDFVFPKDEKVYLKPNCLMDSTPEKCELTHPEFIKSVCRLVLKKRGAPVVCDSPAFGSLEKILKSLELTDWLEEKNIPFLDLCQTQKITETSPLTGRRLLLSRELLDASYVINMPKFKAHIQMKMTGAVKNMYGAVVGKRKALWHMFSRDDVAAFSHLVLKICYAVKPMLTIVDAVQSLSDHGPRRGRPCRTERLIMGTDPVQIDCLLAALIGVPPEDIFTNAMARQKSIGQFYPYGHADELVQKYAMKGFLLPPELKPIGFKPLRVFGSLLRHIFYKLKP